MDIKENKRVILLILDGFGVSVRTQGNAIAAARTPTLDYIEKNYPFATLKASGISVGLSWLEPGNSEVGHMTMGTGRILYQYLPRIIQHVRDGSFFKNEAFLGAVDHIKKNRSNLHIMGLIGSGSVHSYIDHLYALLDLVLKENISKNTYLHLFTDGRDSPIEEGAKFISQIQERIKKMDAGRIATVIGRYYSMDRDLNWDRTKKAYNLLTKGEGEKVEDIAQAITKNYARGITDEMIPPLVFIGKGKTPEFIKENDAVIFFNYREDSARQLTKCFINHPDVGFETDKFKNLYFVSMTQYDASFTNVHVAFEPPEVKNCLSEVLSKHNIKQLKIAETEKYAHVTYFFNGSIEKPFNGEERELVPSLQVTSFALNPEMRAFEIVSKLLNHLEKDKDILFYVVNLANPDMVAHTADFTATVKAIEVIDTCIKKIMSFIEKDYNTILMIVADHGNAELMIDPYTGEKLPDHTTNNVPFYIINPNFKRENTTLDTFKAKRESKGFLSDVAPTILDIFNIPIPPEMTGKSLLRDLDINLYRY